MIQNGTSIYYHNKNGAGVTGYTGWKQLNGKWYYFGLNGNLQNGWFKVGEKTYYSNYSEGIVTGGRIIDKKLYVFDANGALTEEVTYQNGWLKRGNNRYYYKNGALYQGEQLLKDGKVYLFREGRLLSNEFLDGSAAGYYADENGVMVRNAWKKVSGKWYYFGADGEAYTGCKVIDGKNYYFNSYGVLQ